MPDLTPEYAELRRLAEAATPGPWYLDGPWWHGDDDSAYCISTAEEAGRIAVTISPPKYIFGGEREVRDANARYIAAANPAVVLALLERDALAAKVERLAAVHARYFDLDGRPGYDDTNPPPEDVWRFDRDFRAALDATEADHA